MNVMSKKVRLADGSYITIYGTYSKEELEQIKKNEINSKTKT